MGRYALTIPLTGAESVALHQGSLEVGLLGSGSGVQHGGTVGASFRSGEEAGGGSLFDFSVLSAYVPKKSSLP